MPNGNSTSDTEIINLSIKERYIVVTKDTDFWNIYHQKAEPYKLIYLTVGNFTSQELLQLFDNNLSTIIEKIKDCNAIEINRKNIISII